MASADLASVCLHDTLAACVDSKCGGNIGEGTKTNMGVGLVRDYDTNKKGQKRVSAGPGPLRAINCSNTGGGCYAQGTQSLNSSGFFRMPRYVSA